MGRRIEVVPYDSSWPAAFELEREKVSLVPPRYMARKHDWIRSTIREALAHYGVSSHRPPN